MNKQTGFPSTAASAARKPLLTSIFAIILDIGMLIVAILAYIGAQTDQDSSIIRETHITFPSNAHHIQRLEIALPAISLVVNIALDVLIIKRVGKLKRQDSLENRLAIERAMTFFFLPWHSACLLTWAFCIGFQSSYVPMLDINILPECAEFGDELTQCGMVSATWILAIIYCLSHIVLIVLGLNVWHLMRHPGVAEDPRHKYYFPASSGRQGSAAPSFRSSRPPSYRTTNAAPPSYQHYHYRSDIPLQDREGPPRLGTLMENN